MARGARVRVSGGGRVELAEQSELKPESRIEVSGGTVSLGPGARLGERAVVSATVGVRIGARAIIGPWAAVHDGSVGNGAVLGPHAVVEPGAHVPAGARIDAYAVVRAPESSS